MNIWHDLSPKRVRPEDFVALIEIPKGSKNKYELDKETGLLKLDRVLFAGLTKKNLRRGDWRFLTEKEVDMLRMGAFE